MLNRFLPLVVLLAFASGCGLKAQTYVMTKERVGIEKGSGNAGYLSGTPQFVEPTQKTRKIYVFEITKAIPEGEAKKIEQEVSTTTQTNVVTPAPVAPPADVEPAHVNKIVIPRIDDEAPAPAAAVEKAPVVGPTTDTTYTVVKDDTLQKIAMKFYGSHKSWYKIYKANKEKMKNPNNVRPGTVITIPAVK